MYIILIFIYKFYSCVYLFFYLFIHSFIYLFIYYSICLSALTLIYMLHIHMIYLTLETQKSTLLRGVITPFAIGWGPACGHHNLSFLQPLVAGLNFHRANARTNISDTLF